MSGGCGGESAEAKPGSGKASTPEQREHARLALYRRMFGEPLEVDRDHRDASPRIDVHVHAPGFAGREFYTLVTSGMSDRPMTAPDDFARDVRRAELLIYVDQPGPSWFELLRTIALLPLVHQSWIGHGHTIPNGEPPKPLFPGSALCAALVLFSNVAPESDARRVAEIDGDPLNLLMLLPITAPELALKLRDGTNALLDVFNTKQLSFVVDPGRASVI